MTISVAQFEKDYIKKFLDIFAVDYKEGSAVEQFRALGELVRSYYADKVVETANTYLQNKEKQIYYFSMEFLPGRMLKSNLLNLGLLDVVRKGCANLGIDFEKVALAEVDPALGNGGLGRLASCFMDSMASTGVPGHGNGIRYRYGLFKQTFVNGYQVELPENWLRNPNVWEVRKENKAVIVRFGGQVQMQRKGNGKLAITQINTRDILAVPYDTAQIGYENGVVNNLRLWSAEIPVGDEDKFSTHEEREDVKRITEVLYPDDSNYEGRLLRLKQEYFFCSAGIQSVLRYYRSLGLSWNYLPDKVGIHINDTHPTLVIPEIMRILLDEEGLSWDRAWEITKKTCSYTNHTILQEAMERWPEKMVQELLPRIYQIIVEINRRHIEKKRPIYGEALAYRTAIIDNGQIKMAPLAIIGSHSVNGVAALHTEILEKETLNDFYMMYPAKFNNKTNGITRRRWLQIANERLTNLIDSKIGQDWKKRPQDISLLKVFKNDKATLEELAKVKLANKEDFAKFVKETMDIDIDPEALFDVQIKRLHAYKRQLLNVLHIIDRYLQIKDNPSLAMQPRVFIFGAKAAPSYHYAKQIIKLINALADLVNNDPDVEDRIKIVFVENYGVTLAEKIIPTADVSEQISLAGKEASGTSNMKLMANGALTVATLDGANVEIREYVGDENIFLFGLTNEEVQEFYRNGQYNARALYETNPRLRRVLNTLIDGTIPNIQQEGIDIFDSLVVYNDEYFVLQDFDSYVHVQAEVDKAYQNKEEWYRRSLLNIASAGAFSSDYTIIRYAEEIWHIDKTFMKRHE